MVATRDLGNISKEQLEAELAKHTEGVAAFQKKLSVATEADALRAAGDIFEADELLRSVNLKSGTSAESLGAEGFTERAAERQSAFDSALAAFDSPTETIDDAVADVTDPLVDERPVLDTTTGTAPELIDLTAPGFEASVPPTPEAPPVPQLFDPPSVTSDGGGTITSPPTVLGSISSPTVSAESNTVSISIGGGSAPATGGATSANVSDIAQGVAGDLPTGGQVLSDVGASILTTRTNIESLLRRKRRVGFSETRLAAQDKATVARRTLLSGSKKAEVQATSTKKAENIFKGSSKISTLLGRRK